MVADRGVVEEEEVEEGVVPDVEVDSEAAVEALVKNFKNYTEGCIVGYINDYRS